MNGRRDRAEGVEPSAAPAITAVGGLVVCAAVVVLGVFHGGYAPAAWGWAAILALWFTMLMLVLRSSLVVDRTAVAFTGLVVAFVAWTVLSAAWSLSVPRTVLEVERDLVYVGCATAVVLGARAVRARVVIGGLSAGLVIVVAYAFVSYVVTPVTADATQGYLLFRPLGYANALGGVCALALPLALAVGVYDPRAAIRAAAGASTVVLGVALFLTQNRSAWLALGLALVVWFLRTEAPEKAVAGALTLGVPTAVAVALAVSLDLVDTTRGSASIEPRRFAIGGVVLALAAVASALAQREARPRISRPHAVWGTRLGLALVVAAAAFAFVDPGDRGHYWRAAWRSIRHHPLLGGGAGTFDVQWFRYRDIAETVHDAHNLYLGTLAELGVVGLVLLLAALTLPVVSARRTRDPLLAAVLASYCGFLVHVAFEWDWKFPVLAGSALVMASVLVVADPDRRPIQIGRTGRVVGVSVAALAAAFAMASLAGNSYLVSAEGRMTGGDPATAAAEANRARHYVPWASEPWIVIADSDTRAGDLAGARTALREALDRDQNDWALWVRFAAVARGGERTVAVRRALALNPLLTAR